MAGRDLRPTSVLGLLLIALLLEVEEVRGQTPSAQRDVDIQKALLAISAGKLPANDDRLIELIERDLRDVLIAKADAPTVAVEAVARKAQETVSKVTAAYTSAIFRSFSDGDAQQIFARFQNTIERIVEIAKGGNLVPGLDPESSSTRFTDGSRI